LEELQAGATAAAKARRISPNAKITMLEAGPDISFANCGLPYYIGGDIKSRSKLILQSPESFNEQYDVEVHTHTVVSAIDRTAHQVKALDTRSGEQKTFEYSKLILARRTANRSTVPGRLRPCFHPVDIGRHGQNFETTSKKRETQKCSGLWVVVLLDSKWWKPL
jgi:NADPH-dependent 2,4-dienoyl-CoA reductase/sulfur reductase-like enzyme